MITFGDRLRELRIEKELTQEELAKKFDSHKTRFSQYELNKRQADDELKINIANFFNVSIDYLMGVSDIRESAEDILKNRPVNSAGLIKEAPDKKELPPGAKEEHDMFMNYLNYKYGLEKDYI